MGKKILVVSGSPVRGGNTDLLVKWFAAGARSKGAKVEIVRAAFLRYGSNGCLSCRVCQKIPEYACAVKDEARPVLAKMAMMDVIVMATPLYFYAPSAQLKLVMDRMFSLYKWDNKAGTMTTPLKGRTFALIASAFEDVGLDTLEKAFAVTADYSGMKFRSLLVPNAGESGYIRNNQSIRRKAAAFGRSVA